MLKAAKKLRQKTMFSSTKWQKLILGRINLEINKK